MPASHGAERTLPFRLPYGLLRTWNVIMATKFTRQALYDLLWSKPKTVVAAELGLSDVGLGKICREANIPIPPRGYWARIKAGQKPARIPFPVRGLGQTDEVMIGREAWTGREERITELPPAPTFSESLASRPNSCCFSRIHDNSSWAWLSSLLAGALVKRSMARVR